MFNSLLDAMSSSDWTYVLVLVVCALDAVLPILPSETMVVTGGVLAASGQLNVELIMLVGAVGAFLGDNACYWLGRWLGPRARNVLLRGERGKRAYQWAERTLDERGMVVIAAARFVPGGRTATTFTAGATEYPWPKFAVAAGFGAVFWGIYNGLIGLIGGRAFEEQTWKGLLLAFGIAALSAVLIETTRWAISRRKKRKTRQDEAASSDDAGQDERQTAGGPSTMDGPPE
jgi:membrane-associated protein